MSVDIQPLEEQARTILEDWKDDPDIPVDDDVEPEDLVPLLTEGKPLSVNMNQAGKQMFGWDA